MGTMLENYRDSGKALPQERAVLDRMIARESAASSAANAPGIAHGFFRIERVIPKEPVELFGNAAPSRCHNRISVHAEPGGPALFSALLSEHAMSNLLMNTNTSSSDSEATLERVAGHLVEAGDTAETSPEEDIDAYIAENVRKAANAAEEFAKGVREMARAPGKQALTDLAATAQTGLLLENRSFFLKQYQEAAFEKAKKARMEAAALLTHAHLLGHPDAPETDEPVPLSSINEAGQIMLETAVEDAITARAIAHELITLAHNNGISDYDPRKDPNGEALRRVIKGANWEENNKLSDKIKWNSVRLARLLKGPEYQDRDPRHLIAHLSRVSGSGGIHSDTGTDPNSFMTLSFSAARAERSFGQRQVRDATHHPFVTIAMGAIDLMNALRGEAAGAKWSRCTLQTLYGVQVPSLRYEHPLEKMADNASTKRSDADILRGQVVAGKALAEHITTTGLKSAEDRREAARLAAALVESAKAANESWANWTKEIREEFTQAIDEDLRDKFRTMLESRQARVLLENNGAEALRALMAPGE